VDGDLVLVGDFNDGSEASGAIGAGTTIAANGATGDGPATALDLLDAWTLVHGPEDHTPTFDPIGNPLAAVSSLSGRASRLDRTLLSPGGPHPIAAVLCGDVPTPDGLYTSDHYGVQIDLELAPSNADPAGTVDVLDVPPTARTALAWIPPQELWPTIQDLRREHDPQIDRWPPHVNILFGFVPESEFDRAAPLLTAAMAEVEPFAAQLTGVHTFGHREDATVWLDPAGGAEKQWADLRRALEARFPRCRSRSEGFTPHLTLGRTRDPQRTATQCAARLSPMTAQIGELVLLSRRGAEPMRPRAIVTLGTGELRWLPEEAGTLGATAPWLQLDVRSDALTPWPAQAAQIQHIVQRLTQALPNAVVHIVGSRRMDCALPTADLDLVAAVAGTIDMPELKSLVTAALPTASRVRLVIGARVPGLRLTTDGLDIDLSMVATGQIPPTEAVARRAELGEAAATTLSAVTDADAIRTMVDAADAQDRFAHLARAVKAWAKARGLDSAPFGGLPGLAWSILAARVAAEAQSVPPQELLQHFFATWAAWDWREPIALGGPSPDLGPGSSSSPDHDPALSLGLTSGPDPAPANPGPHPTLVTILTPTYPIRTFTAQVGTAGHDLLTDELYRAWEITEAAAQTGTNPWADLLAPPPMHRRHAAWAVLTIRAATADTFDRTHGRVRGRMLTLLAALEASGIPSVHAWPRPFESTPTTATYAIGLGPTPPDKAALAGVATRWATGLSGVTVDLVEGGGVPTLS
jgi:poly(A) polymerase